MLKIYNYRVERIPSLNSFNNSESRESTSCLTSTTIMFCEESIKLETMNTSIYYNDLKR